MTLNLNKDHYNEILSFLLSPLMDKAAEKIGYLVEGGALRSDSTNRFLNLAASFLEAQSSKVKNPLFAATIEKASDFVELAAAQLRGDGGKKSGKQHAAEISYKWRDAFMKKALQRLEGASDPVKEAEKIKLELRMVLEILDFFEMDNTGSKQSQPQQKKLGEFISGLEEKFSEWTKGIKNFFEESNTSKKFKEIDNKIGNWLAGLLPGR